MNYAENKYRVVVKCWEDIKIYYTKKFETLEKALIGREILMEYDEFQRTMNIKTDTSVVYIEYKRNNEWEIMNI